MKHYWRHLLLGCDHLTMASFIVFGNFYFLEKQLLDIQVRYSPKCNDFRFDFIYSSTNDAYTGTFYYLNNYKFETPDENWPTIESNFDDLRKNVEQHFDSNVIPLDRNYAVGAYDDYIVLLFDPQIINELIANDLNIGDPYLDLNGGVPLTYTEVMNINSVDPACNNNSRFLSDNRAN